MPKREQLKTSQAKRIKDQGKSKNETESQIKWKRTAKNWIPVTGIINRKTKKNKDAGRTRNKQKTDN